MAAFAGVYDIAEAGRYLYVTAPEKAPYRPPHYSTVHRWIRSGLPASEARLTPAKDLFLTFEDLVSLRMIVALRAVGFSLKHVRSVHEWLVSVTNYHRPFALRDLWVSDAEIFVEMQDRLLSATRRGQFAMEFIREWLHHLRRPQDGSLDLNFKRVNGKEVASSWTPHPHVLLNPLVQFGAPCLEDTRITTKAVWSMFLGGDPAETIAKDYLVPLFKVRSALEWEKKIAGLPS